MPKSVPGSCAPYLVPHLAVPHFLCVAGLVPGLCVGPVVRYASEGQLETAAPAATQRCLLLKYLHPKCVHNQRVIPCTKICTQTVRHTMYQNVYTISESYHVLNMYTNSETYHLPKCVHNQRVIPRTKSVQPVRHTPSSQWTGACVHARVQPWLPMLDPTETATQYSPGYCHTEETQ